MLIRCVVLFGLSLATAPACAMMRDEDSAPVVYQEIDLPAIPQEELVVPLRQSRCCHECCTLNALLGVLGMCCDILPNNPQLLGMFCFFSNQ